MLKILRIPLLMLAATGMVLFTGCSQVGDPLTSEEPLELRTCDMFTYGTNIIAGQHDTVGQVQLAFTYDYIYVRYTTTDPWHLTEVHVMVVDDPADIPTNGGGAAPGQFDYKDEFAAVNTYTVAVPMRDEWRDLDYLYMAAHCALVKLEGGQVVEEQTGWGEGPPLPGHNWGMYFRFGLPKMLNLPDGYISSRFVGVTGDIPSTFQLANVPSGYDIKNDYYPSFCLDHGIYIYGQWYNKTLVWSSYDPTMPTYARYVRGTYPPGVPVPYDQINYLLNMVIFGWNGYTADPLPFTDANKYILQHIFWYYRGNLAYNLLTDQEKTLVGIANTYGVGFYPGHGQYMAVLMDNGSSVQLCFIVVDP